MKAIKDIYLPRVKFIRNLKGSNTPILVEYFGKKYVIKNNSTAKQNVYEHAANMLYETFSTPVPHSELKSFNGKLVLMNEYVDGIPLGNITFLHTYTQKKLTDSLWLDISMANWDVFGSDKEMSNVIVQHNQPYRVDNGGVFIFRAKGNIKPDYFKNSIVDIHRMIFHGNYGKMAGHMTINDIRYQIASAYADVSANDLQKILLKKTLIEKDECILISEQMIKRMMLFLKN